MLCRVSSNLDKVLTDFNKYMKRMNINPWMLCRTLFLVVAATVVIFFIAVVPAFHGALYTTYDNFVVGFDKHVTSVFTGPAVNPTPRVGRAWAAMHNKFVKQIKAADRKEVCTIVIVLQHDRSLNQK